MSDHAVTFGDRFRSIAGWVSCAFGSPWALATATAVVVVWAASGHYFGYSDGWQLVINTGTTIVTFLMAFLIQATQYRESKAINLKIDELLRAHEGARTGFVNLDNMTDEQLDGLAHELQRFGKAHKIAPVRDATSRSGANQSGKSPQKQRRRHVATAKP